MPVQTVIKKRRDTAANWTSTNPTLAAGEEGYESDTGLSKTGNGTSAWTSLSYDATAHSKQMVKASEAISKGEAVYVNGSDGTYMTVAKASNSTEATSSKTFGLMNGATSSGALNTVVTEGLLGGLDTSTATAGDPVWLGVDGALIFGLANKPVAPSHLVFIGVVEQVSSTAGKIYVKVQNGFELQELHNVLLDSPADNEVLAYDSASGLWKNQTATEAGIAQMQINTGSNWNSTNPVLALGEAGYDTSAGLIKYGDGVNAWTMLNYANANYAFSAGSASSATSATNATNSSTLTALVRNQSGSTIPVGTVVYISGSTTTAPIVLKASNDSLEQCQGIVGITAAPIGNNANGTVIQQGTATGMNTSTASLGDPVWLGTNGALIFGAANKPTAPALAVQVGTVGAVSTSGKIFFKVTQPAASGLPDQAGNSGKYLTTDGTDASWADVAVTSLTNPTITIDINEQSWTSPVSLGADIGLNDSGMGGGQFAFYNDFSNLSVGSTYRFTGTTFTNAAIDYTIDNIPLLYVSRTYNGAYGIYMYEFSVVNSSDEAQFTDYISFNFPTVTVAQVSQASGLVASATIEPLDVFNGLKPRSYSEKTADYTIAGTDVNSLIKSTGSAITVTINDALLPGQRIDFGQFGTGQITFAAGSGVTLSSADGNLKTAKQYAGATVECVAAGVYWLVGNLGA